MMQNSVANLLALIIAAIVPVVFAYFGKKIIADDKAMQLIKALGPLAKQAVIAAEKLGLDQKISGELQKNNAIEKVLDSLDRLGFKAADREIVADAVEKAYADLKDQLENVYKGEAK